MKHFGFELQHHTKRKGRFYVLCILSNRRFTAYVILFSEELLYCFPWLSVPIHFPVNNTWVFPFLCVLTSPCGLDNSHSNESEVIQWCRTLPWMPVWYLCSLWENRCQVLRSLVLVWGFQVLQALYGLDVNPLKKCDSWGWWDSSVKAHVLFFQRTAARFRSPT